MDYYNNQDELYHYGRKGMKWGQHIFGEVKKVGSRVGKKISDSYKQHKEKKANERIMSKPISKLTDAELKQRIERLKLEENASKIMSNIRTNNATEEGKKFMSNLKTKIGEGIANAAKDTATEWAKKKLFSAFGLSEEMTEEIKELTKEVRITDLEAKIAKNKISIRDWENKQKNDEAQEAAARRKKEAAEAAKKQKEAEDVRQKKEDAKKQKEAEESKNALDKDDKLLNKLFGDAKGSIRSKKIKDLLDPDEKSLADYDNRSASSKKSTKTDDNPLKSATLDTPDKDTGSSKTGIKGMKWDAKSSSDDDAKLKPATLDTPDKDTGSTAKKYDTKAATAGVKEREAQRVFEASKNRMDMANDDYAANKKSLEKALGMSINDAVVKQSKLDSYVQAKTSIDSIMSGSSSTTSHARDITRALFKATTGSGNYTAKYAGTSFSVAKSSSSVSSTTKALAGLFGGGYTKSNRTKIASKRAATIRSNNTSRAKAMRSSGKSYEEIAKALGVSTSTVSEYLN